MKRKKKNDNASIVYEETRMSQALAWYIRAKTSILSHHLAATHLLSGEADLKLINLVIKLLHLPIQPLVKTLSTEDMKLQQAAD